MKVEIQVALYLGATDKVYAVGELAELSKEICDSLITAGMAQLIRETATLGARETTSKTKSRIFKNEN